MLGHTERRTFSASTSTVATACSLAAMTAATTRVRPSPGIEAAPPVTPNLVRPKEVPGARNVGRNTLETLLFRGVSTPVAFALVVIQSRFLDPSGRGRFVLVVLTVTILARLFGQLGVAATSMSRHHAVRPLTVRALGWTLALGAAGIGLILASGAIIDSFGLRLAAIAAPALVPNIVNACLCGVLLGSARIRLWNYIQLLPPLLTLAGMLVVVVGFGGGVDAAVAVWTAAYFVTTAFALVAARDLWLPLRGAPLFDRAGRAIVRLGCGMGLVQIVNLIGYRVELFVLDRFKGLAAVGIYSIGMQAAEAMWLIPAAMASAITAPVVHDTPAGAARLTRTACLKGLLYTAGVAVVLGALAPFVIPPLFGDEFRGAARPLAFLLPGVVAYAPVNILVVYLSIRRGRPRLSLYVSIVGLGVTTAASLLLIPSYGASGAALASTIGYAAGTLAAWLIFERLARGDVSTTRPAETNEPWKSTAST
jgi:O-antigen/teichoic acid export membrane protein